MLMLCRNKALNSFQRRFIRLCSITLIATAFLFMLGLTFRVGDWPFHRAHFSGFLLYVLSALPILPFLAMMLLVPRYFAEEKDEFVRSLVMRAMLWAFALPMVLDTIWGFVVPLKLASNFASTISMFNVDIFCATALIAVALQSRRYQ